MKHRLTILMIFLLVISALTACKNTVPKSQTSEASDTAKLQATINKENAITKSEILSFFSSDKEFATHMLEYPATDTNNLEQVILMIIYPLGGNHRNPISFDVFNEYAKKYINKTFADSEFAKYATDEDVVGNNVIMSKRVLYFSGLGGQDFLIKNVEITGYDSASLTCSRGINRDEADTMRDLSFSVQFGRANSQLYIKDIWRTDKRLISSKFPGLVNFDKCYWKENRGGDPRLSGPASYWIRGFVFLNPETLAKFKNGIEWTFMPDWWRPSLDTEILKTDSLKWSYSYYYGHLMKLDFDGNLYFDLKNGIVFFDVHT